MALGLEGSVETSSAASSSASVGDTRRELSFIGGNKTLGGDPRWTFAGQVAIAIAGLVALWIWRKG